MNILIFDTETIGKVSQDLLNVGYRIVDMNMQNGTYAELCKRDYLDSTLYANRIYMLNDDFVGANKLAMYDMLVESKGIIKHKMGTIFKLLAKDIAKYKPVFFYAYNCNFDIDKFIKTAEKLGIENPINPNLTMDIWGYACKYIVDTENYKQWAISNEQLTESKVYISSTVESVTRYLTNNLNFVEDHTALSDTMHETNILAECLKRGCDITKPMKKYFVKSGVVQTETLKVNGETQTIEYTSKYTRNGVTTYKM